MAFAARLAVQDPNALIANFYTVPIALVAIEFGFRAGLAAAAFAFIPRFSGASSRPSMSGRSDTSRGQRPSC